MASTDFTFFTLLDPRKAGFGFTIYDDKEGKTRFVANRTDSYGNPVYRKFQFSQSQRSLRIPNSQADVIKFLEEHPNCEGSNNGDYSEMNGKRTQLGVYFKKIDKGADARVALDAMMDSFAAQTYVDNLEPEGLRDAAILLCNCWDDSPIHQKWELMNLAKNNPGKVLDYKEDESNEIRSIVRRSIKKNIITHDGVSYFLGGKRISSNENGAMTYLLSNPDSLASIQEKLGGTPAKLPDALQEAKKASGRGAHFRKNKESDEDQSSKD